MTCDLPFDTINQDLMDNNEEIAIVQTLHNSDAEAYLNLYNSVPPPSAYEGNTLVVYFKPGAPVLLVLVMKDSCVVGNFQIPIQAHAQIWDQSRSR